MKINWKSRFKNKATLTALIAAIVAFVYQILGIIGIVPAISEQQITEWFGVIINILVMLGIVVDPNTAGIRDEVKEND